jgi:dihydropteroate synthase
MGILNLTPDSFSDGGRYFGMEAALSHAQQMAAAGCDIIDVGGESTRPGALPISQNEEVARIESIFAELAYKVEVPLSIDTYKSKVAARAVELGAILINDVWGLQKDPAMAATVAATEAAVVIMHNRAEKDAGIDIVADIRSFFTRSLALAEAAGIPRSRIILDPGVAFGKTARQNIEILRRLGELIEFGCPILVGTS